MSGKKVGVWAQHEDPQKNYTLEEEAEIIEEWQETGCHMRNFVEYTSSMKRQR